MKNTKIIILALSVIVMAMVLQACDKQATEKNTTTSKSANISKDVPANMILIPEGPFKMGSDKIDASGKSEEFGFNEPWYLPEHPMHEVYLKAYYIDKYEVTNGEFKTYLQNTGQFDQATLLMVYDRLKMRNDKHPIRVVTWLKAQEYCQSVGKRLPTEAEWEKAARGTDGREFPWGDEWNPDYVNAGQNEQDLMPVGSYEKGKSPYGVYDMQGNVMEWTQDWYEAYEGASYQSTFYGKKRRVARGGGWGGVGHYVIPHYFRVSYRYNFPPDQAFDDVGFRCAKD